MRTYFQLLAFTLCVVTANAEVAMPKFFSDNMVLQRDVLIPIWGWANPNEAITVKFHDQSKTTTADSKGNWMLKLDVEKAGGPFQLIISGENTIQINNVLVGEVWLCSGQSNMEWLVQYSLNAKQEIRTANYPNIRHIKVDKTINSLSQRDISNGRWNICDSTTVGDFSAVAYFFARKLYNELSVPIGLINASWGGSNIETWISREGFESSEEFKEMICKMPKISFDSLYAERIFNASQKIEQIQKQKLSSFNEALFKKIDFDDNALPTLYQPKAWEAQSLGEFDGTVWIRKTIELTEDESKAQAEIHLTPIDDEDITFINGVQVGSMNIWNAPRSYRIPSGILRTGKNVIVIKIFDGGGGGGMFGDAEGAKLILGDQEKSLAGEWKFLVESIRVESNQNEFPSLCYNAMIAPLIPFALKGVLWYQGESNAERAFQYQTSFPLLIQDWRKKWSTEFPFYFVQLATYKTNGNSNEGSDWAELREAQTKTLSVAKTGMAVTTDIGNPDDIHPINKQPLGKRLADLALNNDYNRPRVCQSPMYKSLVIKKNSAIVTFANEKSILTATNKNGSPWSVSSQTTRITNPSYPDSTLQMSNSYEVIGFEIAGSDKVFYPAKGIIRGNTVIITSTEVPKPLAIRFGWKGDESECNLFNAEGLPAVPFRTDDWKSITLNKKYDFSIR